MFNIVLVEPEIPQNAGNIARTCAATGTRLHMIRPLGFEVSDKYLKRAGLDYWNLVEIFYYDSFAEFYPKILTAQSIFSQPKHSIGIVTWRSRMAIFWCLAKKRADFPKSFCWKTKKPAYAYLCLKRRVRSI